MLRCIDFNLHYEEQMHVTLNKDFVEICWWRHCAKPFSSSTTEFNVQCIVTA